SPAWRGSSRGDRRHQRQAYPRPRVPAFRQRGHLERPGVGSRREAHPRRTRGKRPIRGLGGNPPSDVRLAPAGWPDGHLPAAFAVEDSDRVAKARRTRPKEKTVNRKKLTIAVAALAVGLAAASIGWAAIPDGGGLIHACYDKVSGQVRIYDSVTDSPK